MQVGSEKKPGGFLAGLLEEKGHCYPSISKKRQAAHENAGNLSGLYRKGVCDQNLHQTGSQGRASVFIQPSVCDQFDIAIDRGNLKV
jgi:hypothetical protein